MKSRQWYLVQKVGNPRKEKRAERSAKFLSGTYNLKPKYKIEPKPSKDRAMHEGDNPSF